MEMKDETRNMEIKFVSSVPYFCLAVKIPVSQGRKEGKQLVEKGHINWNKMKE